MILVTGGAGYIGAHTCVELLANGYEIIIVDNFSNTSPVAVERIRELGGVPVTLYKTDIRNTDGLRGIFAAHAVEAVIHFAGLKAIGESIAKPIEYYDNNVAGTLALLQAMREHNVKNLVFSSSATVYGASNPSPYTEDMPISRSTNPYGQSKIIIEQILEDISRFDPEWNISILRYFNPIGAHESGLIGEDPAAIPNNLCPYITQVAVGKLSEISVYGDDYMTSDGTGVRDYVHVMDLARGHIAALRYMDTHQGLSVFNLGTGKGTSVLEMIRAFESTTGKRLPYSIKARRPGDLAEAVADVTRANTILGWQAKYSINQMCADSWRWQQRNLDGYQ